MASKLVNAATSEKLLEINWTKNIEICEFVAQDGRHAKDVIKAIKKRLDSKNSNVQLFAVSLLEVLMNNIGEPVHKQVMDVGLIPVLVKIVRKKSDLPVGEKIFLLLDATQISVGGAKGRFPQYHKAYYELVSAGLQVSQQEHPVSNHTPTPETRQINMTVCEVATANEERAPLPEPKAQVASESSIIRKATTALEVLRDVLNAISPQSPEAGIDEFTLDLVEQCSYQKQRVMHLVMSSRDERLVSQAIELNEQLGRVLARHDELVKNCKSNITSNGSGRDTVSSLLAGEENTLRPSSRLPTPTTNHIIDCVEEDEEAEQLARRIRKGKARVRAEDEEDDRGGEGGESPFGWVGSTVPSINERNHHHHRPLMRPLSIDSSRSDDHEQPKPVISPISPGLGPGLLIPPPPSKHMERERFFQEKGDVVGTLSGHMRGMSLHSRNASSSYGSGSFDSSE